MIPIKLHPLNIIQWASLIFESIPLLIDFLSISLIWDFLLFLWYSTLEACCYLSCLGVHSLEWDLQIPKTSNLLIPYCFNSSILLWIMSCDISYFSAIMCLKIFNQFIFSITSNIIPFTINTSPITLFFHIQN